jgi:5-methylcytosine-specific restriction enzyme subunit McrC
MFKGIRLAMSAPHDSAGDLPKRTIRLVERRPRECRLRRADVDSLLAEQSATIDLAPTHTRGVYRLTPRGYAGVIVGPRARFVIRPKLPLKDLFHLIDADSRLVLFDDRTDAALNTELIDLLALHLADLLAAQARTGLHHGYVENHEVQTFLQGRLDVAAQMRESLARRTQFHCLREEFTADGLWNRFPKATAECLLRSNLLGPAAALLLRDALASYQPIESVPLNIPDLRALNAVPLPEGYRPLLQLCGLLASGLRPSQRAGDHSFPAFLIDLERLFEEFLSRALQAEFNGKGRYCAIAQRTFAIAPDDRALHPLTLTPDLVIEKDQQPWCILDAKWKNLRGGPDAADVEQVVTYGIALGCFDVRLVYPGKRFRAVRYAVGQRGMRLTIHTLAVGRGQDARRQSLRRLIRSICRGGAGPPH